MVDKDSDIPYYIQIYNALKKRIENGVYKPQDALPPEAEMVKEFNVTRLTVRNALRKLKEDHLISTKKGVGSVVVEKKKIEISLFRFYSFGRDFKDKQFALSTSLVRFSRQEIGYLSRNLKLPETEKVYCVERIRRFENNPMVVEFSYIPVSIAADFEQFDVENNSIYDLLEKYYQLPVTHAKEYLTPFITTPELSELLQVPVNMPVFKTERTVFTKNDIPIEYRVSFIRSDQFRFYSDLK